MFWFLPFLIKFYFLDCFFFQVFTNLSFKISVSFLINQIVQSRSSRSRRNRILSRFASRRFSKAENLLSPNHAKSGHHFNILSSIHFVVSERCYERTKQFMILIQHWSKIQLKFVKLHGIRNFLTICNIFQRPQRHCHPTD